MPFKIPAIVRPLDLAEYDEAFKDQEGSVIWVWVNPPGSVKDEFREARNELMALKGYESIRQNAAIEINPDDYFLGMRRTGDGHSHVARHDA